MELIKAANLGLRFLLELCALAALGYWGYRTGRTPLGRMSLAVGAPLVAAIVWGVFVAPKASVKVPGALLLLLQVIIFGLAAVALAVVGRQRLALIFAVVVVINAILMYVWDQ